MSAVPYTFANASGQVPASELDVNFANVKAAADTAGIVTTNAQPNITSVGTLANLSVSGNITASYFVGNIIGTVTNATYADIANSVTGGNVDGSVAQANYANIANSVTGGNVDGSVAQANYANIANSVTGGNVDGSVAQSNYANIANSVSGSNVSGQVANALIAGTVYTADQPNITSVGTLTILSSSGNIVGANLSSNGIISATGNVTGGNLLSDGLIFSAGNIYFGGDDLLTNNANLNFGSQIFGGYIRIGNLHPSIISIGGNTTNATITLGNTTSTVNIPGVISSISATGNINTGNLLSGGLLYAAGNIYFSGDDLLTSNANLNFGSQIPGGYIRIGNLHPSIISIGGNTTNATITLGNTTSTVNIPGVISSISASGNITGNNIFSTTAFQLPVYANTVTRDAAISSPAIGMLVVVGNTYQGYDGSSWGNITLS